MKKIIGLTGGIASGKTTVANYLQELGYPVIDSDQISRELSKRNMPVYNKIIETFGKEYLLPDLEINRQKLGALIFKNASQRNLLNQISHPIIVEEIKKKIKEFEKNIIFLDIPLLFEAQLSYLCDTIVCVYAPKEIQLTRLMKRDGISKEYALEKIESQLPLEKKKEMSEYVIDSNQDLKQMQKSILEIINQIKGEKNNV